MSCLRSLTGSGPGGSAPIRRTFPRVEGGDAEIGFCPGERAAHEGCESVYDAPWLVVVAPQLKLGILKP